MRHLTFALVTLMSVLFVAASAARTF